MKRNDKKEALRFIQNELDTGKSKKEIFQAMSGNHYEKLALSRIIANIPDPNKKERCKVLNYILLSLIVFSIIPNVFEARSMFIEQPYQTIIASILLVFLYYYFIVGVIRFKGFVYSQIVLFAIIILILNLDDFLNLEIWEIIGIVIVLIFAGLALYLKSRMFPNHGLLGLKRDKEGNYLLE